MIYSRRAIQRRLNELRPTIGDAAVQGLATRLNRPGSDCMAAMWETVVIHGLSKSGTLEYEVPLTSGREPDLRLVNDEIQITADVTCVTVLPRSVVVPVYGALSSSELVKPIACVISCTAVPVVA